VGPGTCRGGASELRHVVLGCAISGADGCCGRSNTWCAAASKRTRYLGTEHSMSGYQASHLALNLRNQPHHAGWVPISVSTCGSARNHLCARNPSLTTRSILKS
jgi:hypothetical protein